ncbi:MAG TPA: RNA polymerase sigma factor [Actinomycetota bacterium]|jgi:RNA polymerase sigma-70 factor (ECF subfamily)
MRRTAVDPVTRDLGEVYEQEVGRLWRSVFAFTQDRALTDDAVAEAFAQCLGRGDAIRDQRAWVWRAAFRLAAGALHDRGRTGPIDDVHPLELPVERSEGLDDVLSALAELPGKQRAAAILRWYAGYPTDEIARMLDVGRPTVRVHLSRARAKLRARITEEDA